MKLTLKNFRNAPDFELALPDTGMVLLKGETGKGKTTLLDGIFDAITGAADDVIPWNGALPVTITLELPSMTIVRTHKPETVVVCLPGGQSFTGEAAQAKIFERLGMASAVEFTAASYIRQRMEGSLLSLKPAEQLRFIQRLAFGDDDPENYKQRIGNQITKRRTALDKLNYQYTAERDAYNRDRTMVESMELSIGPAPVAPMTADEYATVCQDLQNLTNQRKTNDKRLSELNKLLTHPGQLARRLFESETDALVKENEGLSNMLEDCCIELAKVPRPWAEMSMDDQQDEVKKLLEKREYLKWRSDVTKFTAEVKAAFPDFNGAGAGAFLQVKLTENTTVTERVKADLASVRADIANCESIAKNQSCPKCKTPLIVKNGQITCADHNEEIAKVDTELMLHLARTKETSLVKEQSELSEARTSIRIAVNVAEKLVQAKIADPLPTVKTAEEIELRRTELHAYRDQQVKLASIMDNLFKDIERIKDQIKRNEDRMQALSQNAQAADAAGIPTEDQINEERQQIASQNEDLNNIREAVNKKIADYNEHLGYMKGYQLTVIQFETARAALDATALKCTAIEQEALAANKRWSASTRLKECSDAAAISATELIINSINQYSANHLISLFPHGGTSVKLLSGMKLKSGDERSKLSLDVIHRGMEVGKTIRPLSGGEKDRIKVAFQLALAEIYNAPFLMFDEPFAGVDVENTMILCLDLLKTFSHDKLVIMAQHAAPAEPFDLIVDI